MPHYFPQAGAPHRPAALYLSGTLEPDMWVDITGTIDLKAQALACHASQVGPPGEWLRTVVRQRAEAGGNQAGCASPRGSAACSSAEAGSAAARTVEGRRARA